MTSGCFERMAAAGQSKSEKPMGRGQGGEPRGRASAGESQRGRGKGGSLREEVKRSAKELKCSLKWGDVIVS